MDHSLKNNLKTKVQLVKHESDHMTLQEIVDFTDSDLSALEYRDRVKEIILLSEQDVSEKTDWTRENGILIPTKASLLKKWPMECDQKDLLINFHYFLLNEEESFWGTIRKEGDVFVIWFEDVVLKDILWVTFNIVIGNDLRDSDIKLIEEEIGNDKRDRSIYVDEFVRLGEPIFEYTYKFDYIAHTVLDFGCFQPLTKTLLEIIQRYLKEGLCNLMMNSLTKIERDRDLNNFIPQVETD